MIMRYILTAIMFLLTVLFTVGFIFSMSYKDNGIVGLVSCLVMIVVLSYFVYNDIVSYIKSKDAKL